MNIGLNLLCRLIATFMMTRSRCRTGRCLSRRAFDDVPTCRTAARLWRCRRCLIGAGSAGSGSRRGIIGQICTSLVEPK